MIELLLLINANRITPLAEDPALTARAEERADYLCESGQWSHQGWLEGFTGLPYHAKGENLAKGFRTLKGAHKALLKSPTHRANIVKPTYTHVGLAKGDCGVIVELFGQKI